MIYACNTILFIIEGGEREESTCDADQSDGKSKKIGSIREVSSEFREMYMLFKNYELKREIDSNGKLRCTVCIIKICLQIVFKNFFYLSFA